MNHSLLRSFPVVPGLVLGLFVGCGGAGEWSEEETEVGVEDFSLARGGDNGKTTHNVDVLLFDHVSTCFVGDPCVSGDCLGLKNDAGQYVIQWERVGFRTVPGDYPNLGVFAQVECVNLTMTANDIKALKKTIRGVGQDVAEWSSGAFNLKFRFHVVGHKDMILSRWGGGVYVSPWNIAAFETDYLSSEDTDFVIATHAIRDSASGLHHGLGGCGGSFGPKWGRAGAGWSWIPLIGDAIWFECANRAVYTHEWMHQVRAALINVDGFEDLYDRTYPECGQGDPDPYSWYPGVHDCIRDPDYDSCGQSSCGSGTPWQEHILRVHWPEDRYLTANHCRNGIQDFNETGIDVGPKCF